MKSKKTLSVIIPNYNKSNYIGTLIESILNQTRLPDEIIVVDDCSTDNSRDVLLELAKKTPLIKLFFLEENKGVQHARNFGALQSTCSYVTFIDSDDFYFEPKKLENEMKYVGTNKLICSRFYFFNNLDKSISSPDYKDKSFKHYLRHQKYYLIKLKYIPFYPYAYIISKKAFFKVEGYNFKYNLFEDIDILIKLKLLGVKFKYLKSYGRAYRINDETTEHLSYVDNQKILLAKEELMKKYFSKIRFMDSYMRLCRKIKKVLSKEQ